jgi:hypothetical protein
VSQAIIILSRDQEVHIARIGRSAPVRSHNFDIEFWVNQHCFGMDHVIDLLALLSRYSFFEVIVQSKTDLTGQFAGLDMRGGRVTYSLAFGELIPAGSEIIDRPCPLLVEIIRSRSSYSISQIRFDTRRPTYRPRRHP